MSTPSSTTEKKDRSKNPPACAACRKIKMRCIRQASDPSEPCDRCIKSHRPCFIPDPRPLGRRSGAPNKFHGVEKALRQIETEVKRVVKNSNNIDPLEALVQLTGRSDDPVNPMLAQVLTHRARKDPKSKLNTFKRSDSTTSNTSNNSMSIDPSSDHIPSYYYYNNDIPTGGTTPTESNINNKNNNNSSSSPKFTHPTYRNSCSNNNAPPVATPLDLLAEVSENVHTSSSSTRISNNHQQRSWSHDRSQIQPSPSATATTISSSSLSSPDEEENMIDTNDVIDNDDTKDNDTSIVAHSILCHQNVQDLNLSVGHDRLVHGLSSLLSSDSDPARELQYFKATKPGTIKRDLGPEWDPVDLGLLSMKEAEQLFEVYYNRLNAFTGVLDRKIQTASFIRSRSACLFTWIAASGARFSKSHTNMYKRLYRHGQHLNKSVLNLGYKSTEIVQALCLSLYWTIPTSSTSNDNTWLFSSHAMAIAVEMGLDRRCSDLIESYLASIPQDSLENQLQQNCRIELPAHLYPGLADEFAGVEFKDHDTIIRFARCRERTWLRLQLFERGMAVMLGNSTFQDNELSSSIDNWWIHPLAIPEDRQTCALVHLRRRLAFLNSRITGSREELENARELVDGTLDPWLYEWLPNDVPRKVKAKYTVMSDVSLRYVYRHNRLWMLSLAMHGNPGNNDISRDCLQAALSCCEAAVFDLSQSDIYHGMADSTWSMLSYSAVFALKVFPSVATDITPGSQAQLLGLLANLGMALERVGKDGFASLYGHHLLIILRARARAMKQEMMLDDGSSIVDSTKDKVQASSLLGNKHDNIAFDAQREIVGIRYHRSSGSGSIDPMDEHSTQRPLTASTASSSSSASSNVPAIFDDSYSQNNTMDGSDVIMSPISDITVNKGNAPYQSPVNGHWPSFNSEPRWEFEVASMLNNMWYDPATILF